MQNFKIINKKIDILPENEKKHLRYLKLDKEKNLYFLNEDYPKLPDRHKIHNISKMEKSNELVELMKKNESVKNFLCVNFQFFLTSFDNNIKIKCKKNKDVIIDFNSLISFKETFFFQPELPELENKVKDVFSVLKFGFVKNKPQEVDENLYYFNLSSFFLDKISYFKNCKLSFKSDILNPLKLILDVFDNDLYETDDETYIYIKEKIILEKFEKFFYAFQLHKPFEYYVHSILKDNKFQIINPNPLIFVNPIYSKNYKNITGYLELDGSFVLKEKKNFFIECKNSFNITQEHVTNFLGKTLLIENVYDIKIKKILFSTGSRYPIWKGIEKYKNIFLFDVYDFKNNFSRVKNFII
jgi:hypothetical protein